MQPITSIFIIDQTIKFNGLESITRVAFWRISNGRYWQRYWVPGQLTCCDQSLHSDPLGPQTADQAYRLILMDRINGRILRDQNGLPWILLGHKLIRTRWGGSHGPWGLKGSNWHRSCLNIPTITHSIYKNSSLLVELLVLTYSSLSGRCNNARSYDGHPAWNKVNYSIFGNSIKTLIGIMNELW